MPVGTGAPGASGNGGATGVTENSLLHGPGPNAKSNALIWKAYATSLVSPVTVWVSSSGPTTVLLESVYPALVSRHRISYPVTFWSHFT